MPDCYLCGCHIPRGQSHRRRVNTGSSSGWSTRGTGSFREYFGDRSVCAGCATAIDRAAAASHRNMLIVVVAVLCIGAFVYFKNASPRSYDEAPPEPNATITAPAEDTNDADLDVAPPAPTLSDPPISIEPSATIDADDEVFHLHERRLSSLVGDLERRIASARAALTAADPQPLIRMKPHV